MFGRARLACAGALVSSMLVFVAPTAAASSASQTLVATVGPGATIALRTTAGASVARVPAGRYVVVVRDRSRNQNFRLTGPATSGLDRSTSMRFVGTVRWTVTLVRGQHLYWSDSRPQKTKRSFSVL
jgi:hypothetical protein